jgi:hypothetical protein
MDIINKRYLWLCNTSSDINEHLPILYKYACECNSVFETGVRGCISSWAFVKGLLNNKNIRPRILLNDITECNIENLLQATSSLNIDVNYKWINNLELSFTETYDLTFIDTWHVYGQLKRELAKFAPITNKYIILHDTTVDAIYGETIRCNWNASEQSARTKIPVSEINCGLWKAVEEFLENNKDWVLLERLTNNNGLTILNRI